MGFNSAFKGLICCNSTQFTAAPSAHTNMGQGKRSTILSAVLYCVKICLSHTRKNKDYCCVRTNCYR